jgi:uncharacterized membrane protein
MLAEISFYNVVLFIHVAAVVLAFGVTFSYALVFSVTRKGYERHLPYLHHVQAVVGERLIAPLGGVILLAGIYLAIKGPYDFGEPWIGITLLILIVLLAAGGAYFGPREKRLSELAARDVEASPEGRVTFSAEYEQLFSQVRTVILAANALVLLAIFLMVTKP